MQVEVVYGSSEQQQLLTVELPQGSTAQMAVVKSDMRKYYPEIDLNQLSLGVFSKPINPETVLYEGDRVEIYRPLTIDPMQRRRLRQAQK